MAQPTEDSTKKELLSLLKIDEKGWNIALFENNVKHCLCAHCGSVCCDAVELGCEHEEDDIFLYCKCCLSELIRDNDNKCMITSHINPPLIAARATRRQISKSTVMCLYSREYKLKNAIKKNDVGQIIDTPTDEKEGHQSVPIKENENNICQWKGTLSDLINKHIFICAKKNDPTFILNMKIEMLKNENSQLKQQIKMLKNELNIQQNQNNEQSLMIQNLTKSNEDGNKSADIKIRGFKNENIELKQEIQKLKNQLNEFIFFFED
eukprot:379170_1